MTSLLGSWLAEPWPLPAMAARTPPRRVEIPPPSERRDG